MLKKFDKSLQGGVIQWQNVMYAARAFTSVTMSAIIIEEATLSGSQMYRALCARQAAVTSAFMFERDVSEAAL